tara:strand:+ start:21 stop:575 length:555 start_codon:yes stop_codon:yes gene_type:complete
MKIVFITIIFFLITFESFSSIKEDIIIKLKKIDNLEFNFTQTINGKDEKGKCIISYPKKIKCKYILKSNKILVSNGKSLVIKSDKNNQYYRYPLDKTPLNLLLDKKYILNKIKKLDTTLIDDKYYLFSIKRNDNLINLYFEKKSLNLIGWQTEDMYQNLTITYIYNLKFNKKIDEKIFLLPKIN